MKKNIVKIGFISIYKRIRTLFLILIFLAGMTACSASASQTPTYEEKDITQSSGLQLVVSSKVNSKNQIVVCGYKSQDSGLAYITLDASGKGAGEIKTGDKGDGSVFALDSTDNLYVLSQSVVTDESSKKPRYTQTKLLIYGAEGKVTKSIDLGQRDAAGERPDWVSNMEVDSKGNIYLLRFGSSIEVLDKDGKTINRFENSKYNSMTVCEDDNLAVTSWGGQGNEFYVEQLNTSSGQSMWKQSLIVNTGDQFISCNKTKKIIYVTDGDGIKRYDSSGKLIGYAMKYSSYSIPGVNRFIAGINADAADTIYVISRSGDFSENSKEKPSILYKYSLVLNPKDNTGAEAEAKKEIEIALSAMQYISGNRFIDNAIKTFEQKHKDFKIKLREYGSVQSMVDLEKYVKTISTEIMSGKGPDLISVGYLPYQKYIDKGALLNLSDFMAEDSGFKADDYYTNILEACKYKGNLYAMPVNFMFSAIIADKEALKEESVSIPETGWTVEDFLAIAEKVTRDTNGDGVVDRYAMPDMTAGNVFSYLGGSDAGRFVDYEKKEARFASKEFIDLLNTSKAFIDKKLCNTQVKPTDVYDLTNRGGTVFIAQGCWNYMGMYSQMAFYNGNGWLYHFPSAVRGEKAAFDPQLFYGINKSTKYPKECWEFIKTMLSEDLQTSFDLPGFALNKAAQQQRAMQAIGYESSAELDKIENKIKPISKEDTDYMDKLVSELGRTAIMDTQISSIVGKEIKSYFSGAKSAEDTASAIQKKVETYLNE